MSTSRCKTVRISAFVFLSLVYVRLLQAVDSVDILETFTAPHQPNWQVHARGEHRQRSRNGGAHRPVRSLAALLLSDMVPAAFNFAASAQSAALHRPGRLGHTGPEMKTIASMFPKPSIWRTFNKLKKTQFIAADPGMQHGDDSSGEGALQWGLWVKDPGPRGVELSDYDLMERNNGLTPAGWTFDSEDWWLEEYGRIMEKPKTPIPNGMYVLPWLNGGNAGRAVILTIKGDHWELDKESGAKLRDVTHLPCRSARYTPILEDASPKNARVSDFPVTPGSAMPCVEGYKQVDYAVLFVEGREPSSKPKPKPKPKLKLKPRPGQRDV